MRIHRLRLEAFGPFPDVVDLDLDEVSAAGLFLVHGPTGAGKTSLLDAVCFALYADVPGARSNKTLASQHAPVGTKPQVTLDFTASGRRLRITRSPAFPRPGRGTDVPAAVHVEERTPDGWTSLSRRHGEADDVVGDVLGLGREQFARVVLLPQGDFAAFLRAGADERAALLQRLFDVSGYVGVEQWLAEQRRSSVGTVRETRGLLDAAVRAVADELALLPSATDRPAMDGSALSDLPPDELSTTLQQARSDLADRVVTAQAALDQTGLQVTSTAEALSSARRLAERQARGASAHASLTALTARHDEVCGLRERVEAAGRAAACLGELRVLETAQDQRRVLVAGVAAAQDRARQARVTVAAERGELDGPLLRWEQAADALRPGLEDATRELVDVERLVAEGRQRIDRLRAGVTGLSTLEERHGQADEAHRTAAARVEQALLARQESAATQQRVEELARRRDLLDELTGAQGRWTDARASVDRARRDQVVAREELVGLRETRLADMAGELATDLSSGCPCPVCGAVEHPRPARRTSTVTEGEIEQAAARRDAAEAELTRVSSLAAGLEATVAALRERLGDQPARDELTAELAQAELQADELVRRAAGLPAAQAALADTERTREALTVEESQLQRQVTAGHSGLHDHLARTRTTLRQAHDGLAEHEQCPCVHSPSEQLPGDLPVTEDDPDGGLFPRWVTDLQDLVDRPTVLDDLTRELDDIARQREALAQLAHERVANHDEARAAVATWRDQLVRAAESEQAVRQAEQSASAVATEQGFPDLDAVRAASLPREQVARAQQVISDYDRELDRAQVTLTDPDVAAALEQEAPDLVAVERAHGQAQADQLHAKGEETATRHALARVTTQAETITALMAELGPAEDRAHRLAALSELAEGRGENAKRMALSTYVLAARLERVVALSNERLAAMGEGRYRLEHDDSVASKRTRAGLGLRVRDDWTGASRDTTTLSGGESFMVSLALALGLADAVREEAGGYDLQTLFVDEGFGTLDEESLEQVMAVLDTLRSGGRAVGIVSHVADLRHRIATHLEVRKSTRGSTVHVRTEGQAQQPQETA